MGWGGYTDEEILDPANWWEVWWDIAPPGELRRLWRYWTGAENWQPPPGFSGFYYSGPVRFAGWRLPTNGGNDGGGTEWDEENGPDNGQIISYEYQELKYEDSDIIQDDYILVYSNLLSEYNNFDIDIINFLLDFIYNNINIVNYSVEEINTEITEYYEYASSILSSDILYDKAIILTNAEIINGEYVMSLSTKIEEIHACLGAGEYAYYNVNLPVEMHMARNLDYLMKSLGLYYNPDGTLMSITTDVSIPPS